MASSASMEQWTILVSTLSRLSFEDGKLTLDRRQTKLFRDLCVLNPCSILKRHTADQLGQVTRTGDRAAATESLELHIADGVVVGVDTDLQLHDVAACGSADETGTDISVGLRHGADIARLAVVVEQCCEC
jgi:hypothetical protein